MASQVGGLLSRTIENTASRRMISGRDALAGFVAASVAAFLLAVICFLCWMDHVAARNDTVLQGSASVCFKTEMGAVGSYVGRSEDGDISLAFASGLVETYPVTILRTTECPA